MQRILDFKFSPAFAAPPGVRGRDAYARMLDCGEPRRRFRLMWKVKKNGFHYLGLARVGMVRPV